MTTGLALRQRMISNARGALGMLGKTTATAASTDSVTDTLRWNMNTLSPEDASGRYIRLTQVLTGTATGSGATSLTDSSAPFTASALIGYEAIAYTAAGLTTVGPITANTTSVLTITAWSNGTPSSTSAYAINYCHIAIITRADTDNGKLFFDPPTTTATFTGTEYEVVPVFPDDMDEAKDYALTRKCAPWRNKPLSVVKEVADWTVASAVNATATVQTLDYPREMFDRSMLVANSGANGYIPSESYYVQPKQQYTIFGRVSVRAQTASVRLRRITSTAADITLNGTSTFTLRGDQWFWVTATIPDDCEEVQIWLGGASASCISEWSGVGMLPQHEVLFSLENRLLSKHDVGDFWVYNLPITATGRISREPLYAAKREHTGNGVTVLFDTPPGAWPVYYQERHRYAALQSDYLSLNDRATGDGSSTDCDVDYAAWAAIVELLEARKRTDELDRLLAVAYKNLRAWDREVGAEPIITSESRSQGGIGVLSL